MISRINVLKLSIAIGICQLAGIIGALFTTSAISSWYAVLVRPELAPPNWIFGPVWTILYTMMGVSVFLVWREGLEQKNVRIALSIFAGQLVLNVLWSLIFFGLRSPGEALIEIAALWLSIVVSIVVFGKISRPAAWLLLPYLMWVSFASYLNYMIWLLN